MYQSINIANNAYVLTFEDDFDQNRDRYWQGFNHGQTWATSFSPHQEDTRWIQSNNVQHYFVDPDDPHLTSPFTISDGAIEIRARDLSEAEEIYAADQPYSAGLLTTEMTFAATSGYIEIRADIPDEQGLWSSFWLLPADGDWSAEIDIAEILGDNTDAVLTNLWDDGAPSEVILHKEVGDGFHTFGLLWTPEMIQWSIDGTVYRTTANTVFEPMYLSMGLAIGGWNGGPDETTDFSDPLKIDYVRVYELEADPDRNDAIEQAGVFEPIEMFDGTSANDILTGSHWGDRLNGGAGSDVIYGRDGDDDLHGDAGDDVLYGHSGQDRLVGGAGRDRLFGGQGSDVLEGGSETDHLWPDDTLLDYGACLHLEGLSFQVSHRHELDTAVDTFLFLAGDGTDYIHEFDPFYDLIDLSSFDTTWTEVEAAISDFGWATHISTQQLGGQQDDMIFLVDLDAYELTEDSFIL